MPGAASPFNARLSHIETDLHARTALVGRWNPTERRWSRSSACGLVARNPRPLLAPGAAGEREEERSMFTVSVCARRRRENARADRLPIAASTPRAARVRG